MSKQRPDPYEVFCNAIELESNDARKAYLEGACAAYPEIRREVDELLETYRRTPPGFLEQKPWQEESDSILTRAPNPTTESNSTECANEVPRPFGEYELLDVIAHGGMGIVYRARQVRLDRLVALKMILTGKLASEDELRRFEIEARAAAALNHSGIVPVHEVGCHEGRHFFSMGLVEGESLAEVIRRGALDPLDAASLLRKVALAVQAAHDQGIIHRDLKPSNILIDAAGEPKVTDFGLAKQVEGASDLTATGMVIGTPSYMSPEQAAGKLGEIHVASDVYSLGALLYAMLTGRPPYRGDSQMETLMQVVQGELVPPRQRNRLIPRDLEAICLKCLEVDPRSRYDSAADLAADLSRFLQGDPVAARQDWLWQIRKWGRRRPVLAAHWGATAVMMLTVVANFVLLGPGNDVSLLALNLGIMALWALVVMVLQFAQDGLRTKFVIPYLWAALNPAFLTWILACNEPPRGALLSLFLVLLVFECFLRRADLVVVTTIVSLMGTLFLIAISFQEEVGATLTPDGTFEVAGNSRSYLVINFVGLAFAGFLLTILTHRLQQLTQAQHE